MPPLQNALESVSRLSPDTKSRMKALACDSGVNYVTVSGFLKSDILGANSSDRAKVELWRTLEYAARSMISFRLYFVNELPGEPPYEIGYEEYTVDEEDTIHRWIDVTEEISSMKTFKVFLNEIRTTKHCVRCHKGYTEAENKRESCQIAHVFPDPEYERKHDRYYRGFEFYDVYASLCCGPKVTVDVWMEGTMSKVSTDRPCFRGKHTDRTNAVDYNKSNIRKCAMENGACRMESLAFKSRRKVNWISPYLLDEESDL